MRDNSLSTVLNAINPKPLAEDEEDLGVCASRPSPKWFHGLVIKRKDYDDSILMYQYLAVHGTGNNTKFTLVFAGHEVFKLVVHGRNLLRLFYYLKEQRIEFIRESDRDFGDEKQVHISKIELSDITPKGDA